MASLTDAIKAAIIKSEQSPYAIAKGAGIARSQLSRLLSGESSITVKTLERLAEYLELRISIEPRSRNGKGK